ncbi:hypothetical protein JMJ35_004838 [Cladonia borealis]|uniref:Fungal N-terminal domain-containing protein n=1 Tax=Cladonia borealis TaxID=184061 RepID=A0AA39R2I0_9LECA|nr:hypothetical protein JMJ35_004838 [Cladonia borealis]
MDGISVAASIIGIAEAGFQIATKLITLATQISTASDRVSSIGNDISLTSGVLRQLGELMNQNQKTTDDGISIFKEDGLELTRKSAAACERIFLEVKNEAMKASKQIRESKWLSVGKMKLSNAEKAKWPFLQPSIEILRGDLREAKGTLMLMLQLGSLALCKRMADINQEASLNKTEQRDFMLAIKALLQDQKDAKRDEHHDRTKEIPKETSRHKISNTTTRSPGSDTDKSDPPATLGINSPNQVPLDPRVSELNLQLQVPESSAPTPAVLSPESPPGTTNDRKGRPGEHGPRERVVRPNLPEPKLRMGLHLFLLKPVVENFFDKIELLWLLQNTQMRESAINRYMAGQDYRADVFNMLHTLHPYEQKILDGVIFGIDMSTEGSLLSLKRTKTTICHRDITFEDVPGLQFVVRRERRIPDAVPPNIPEPPISPRMSSRRRRSRHRRHHYSDDSDSESEYERVRERTRPRREFRWQREDPAEDPRIVAPQLPSRMSSRRRPSRPRRYHYSDDSDSLSRAHGSRARQSRAAEDHAPSLLRSVERAIVSSDSEDQGYTHIKAGQEPMALPEQNEDAVIDDMLKRYTTLFD